MAAAVQQRQQERQHYSEQVAVAAAAAAQRNSRWGGLAEAGRGACIEPIKRPAIAMLGVDALWRLLLHCTRVCVQRSTFMGRYAYQSVQLPVI